MSTQHDPILEPGDMEYWRELEEEARLQEEQDFEAEQHEKKNDESIPGMSAIAFYTEKDIDDMYLYFHPKKEA